MRLDYRAQGILNFGLLGNIYFLSNTKQIGMPSTGCGSKKNRKSTEERDDAKLCCYLVVDPLLNFRARGTRNLANAAGSGRTEHQ